MDFRILMRRTLGVAALSVSLAYAASVGCAAATSTVATLPSVPQAMRWPRAGDGGAAQSLLNNPGFEAGESGWRLQPGASIVPGEGHHGSAGLRIVQTGPADHHTVRTDLFPVTGGARYTFGARIKTQDVRSEQKTGDQGALAGILFYDAAGKVIHSQAIGGASGGPKGTTDWSLVQYTEPAPAASVTAQMAVYLSPEMSGTAWFDDVFVGAVASAWHLYVIRPVQGVVYGDDGAMTVRCWYDDPAGDRDAVSGRYACVVQVSVSGAEKSAVCPVANGRAQASFGALSPGDAQVVLTLVDLAERTRLAEETIPLRVVARQREVPPNACLIDERGRAWVDGKKFMPVGLFCYLGVDEPELLTSPFNTFMPYSSRFFRPRPSVPLDQVDEAMFMACMDTMQQHGKKVILALHDMYEGTPNYREPWLGVRGSDRMIEKMVPMTRRHPALLGWYTSDELPLDMLDTLKARRQLIHRLDPWHPTFAVHCTWKLVPAFGGISDVTGVDPYPIRTAESRDMKTVAAAMDGAAKSGLPVWVLPQFANLGIGKSPERFRAHRAPTEAEMRSMALYAAIRGATGFLFYAHGMGIRADYERTDQDRRWPEVCRVAEVMNALAPFILSDAEGPAVTLDVAAGDVAARAFRDDAGNVRILVAGVGPGESRATLRMKDAARYRSQFGHCAIGPDGVVTFSGTDICSDVLHYSATEQR